jgi:hypothetical protein
MKKEGYNARLNESLGRRNKGKKKQSLKSRRKESEGMEKAKGKRKYAADKSMEYNKPQTKKAKKAKVKKVMDEYKEGKLHSGSKKGPKVKSRKQALAIALNEAGISKKRGR